MEEHREAMERVAKDTGCGFVDLLDAFSKEAEIAKETLYTPGYPMPKEYFLHDFCMETKNNPKRYPKHEGPYLMNAMTQYFNPADGHHLEFPAHRVIYNTIAKGLGLLEQEE